MKKIHLFTVALVAMCAFSALVTASASAVLTFEKAEWLANGTAITEALLADWVGELLTENLLNTSDILCSFLYEGTVGPGGADTITMVYDLAGKLIEELGAAGTGLLCESMALCEPNTAETWPTGLPWKTEALLDPSTGLFYELIENSSYHIFCLGPFGIAAEELCGSSDAAIEVLNVAGGVEPMGAFEPEGECNGNAEEGFAEAVAGGLISLTGGGTLTISN
jgi:hypothetical protein